MDNHEACQSPAADSFARNRTGTTPCPPAFKRADLADFRAFRGLARLMLNEPQRESSLFAGRKTMAKFEVFAFSVCFIATGLLTLVALPLA
jgi:hypothetical protein